MKRRLFASFSGGKSSAYMAWLLSTRYADQYEIVYVFSNTGEEDPRTLVFVQACDMAFGLGVVWVEADVQHGERKRTGFRRVDFANASRDGEPFESMIRKYGIPNRNYPHCTRELKLRPMYAYIESLGWEKGSFDVAVGLRADEPRRIRADAAAENIVYPLAHWIPTDKQDVNSWWEAQPFNLQIKEREGNCKWCWKKSDRKHAANIAANPQWYSFPERMEREFANAGAGVGPRAFFRGGRTTFQLFQALSDVSFPPDPGRDDEDAGCSESCEAFGAPLESLDAQP